MKLMWLVLSSNGRRQFPMAFMPPRKRCRPIACGCSSEPDESSSLDMDALQQRINRQNGQYSRLLVEQLKYSSEERKVPESVHIILFQPGTDQQHVHTIEMPIGSGNNLILAFESGADCVSFARDLQDLEFGQPHPGPSPYSIGGHLQVAGDQGGGGFEQMRDENDLTRREQVVEHKLQELQKAVNHLNRVAGESRRDRG